MLRVTIHAGGLDTATRFTQRARVDIGYEKLAPIADYKTVLFQSGFGASVPASIYKYPRWSASLWDLAARSIALGLRTDFECLNEELPYFENRIKRFAFAPKICALIEHAAPAGQSQRTLASVEIMQVRRLRGTYVACFEEHTMARHVTEPFVFRPGYLRAAELVLHACLMRLHGKLEMPARPALCVPSPVDKDGQRYVPIHRLIEPARTGFVSWLLRRNEVPLDHPGAPLGIMHESLYGVFLSEAV
jgi:hypothetical protein